MVKRKVLFLYEIKYNHCASKYANIFKCNQSVKPHKMILKTNQLTALVRNKEIISLLT